MVKTKLQSRKKDEPPRKMGSRERLQEVITLGNFLAKAYLVEVSELWKAENDPGYVFSKAYNVDYEDCGTLTPVQNKGLLRRLTNEYREKIR